MGLVNALDLLLVISGIVDITSIWTLQSCHVYYWIFLDLDSQNFKWLKVPGYILFQVTSAMSLQYTEEIWKIVKKTEQLITGASKASIGKSESKIK